jgi:hypothetical protein
MCLRRAPEKYIAGAALDRAGVDLRTSLDGTENSASQVVQPAASRCTESASPVLPRPITNLRGLSSRANYTDRATAACPRSYCQLLRIEGATWSAWRIPTAVFSDFSTGAAIFFFQVAVKLYSRGWVDPVPDPLLLRKSGSAGNRTQTSGSVVKNSDH